MPQITRDEYTAKDQARYDAAYYQLRRIVWSDAPDAEKFRRALDKELAVGFLIDWPRTGSGYTLLHWAACRPAAIRAGLPQVLIAAGADVDIKDSTGSNTPLGLACWRYVYNGGPNYLTAVDTLLEAGARPELDEGWLTDHWEEYERRGRRDWLDAYIKTWPERRAARAGEAFPDFDYAL